MKALVIAGLVLSMTSYGHLETGIASSIDTIEQQLLQDFNTLEQLLFSPDAADQNRTQQVQQVVNDINQVNQQLMDQVWSHRLGIKRLPHQRSAGQQSVSANIQISSGDRGVSSKELQQAKKIIQTISLPILKANAAWNPQSNSSNIVLYSTPQAYGNALLKAGATQDEISNIVSKTGGLTIGSDVWIPLYNLQDTADLANVLTHELTHVAFNEQGIGDTLPTWVNEGTAWYDGLSAESQVNPAKVQAETNDYNQQISQTNQTSGLLPLTASEQDILKANYNVEWVDYLAVKNLIDKYGIQKYQDFLNGVKESGVETSYQQQFHETIDQYQSDFISSLS